MTDGQRSEEGFSIVEAMVAIAILAVGMTAVATMLTTAMQSNQYSYQSRDADVWALRKIEDLKSAAKDRLITAGPSSGEEGQFKWSLNITNNSPTPGIDRVDINIGWGGDQCSKTAINKCTHGTTITNFVMVGSP